MNTPPRAAGRSATGMVLPPAPINLSRSFTVDSVRRFLNNGNDINQQDADDGSTLLMEAVARGKEDVVEYLLDAGADVNIQDSDGLTALGYYKAAIHKDGNLEKIVQMILEAGALFLPDTNGQMVNIMAENLYEELASELAYRNAYNSPYSYGSNRYEYGNSSPSLGRIRQEITANERARQAAQAKEAANRWAEKEKAEKEKAENNANTAWRASVGLPPSEREATREYPPTTRRAKNIRDLINLYINRYVREIKLGLITASANKDMTMFVDLRTTVFELKQMIQYFFNLDMKFELVYPHFHLEGKKTLDDDRSLSDYGFRNGSRLILVPKIKSGYRGGTRRSKRQSQQRKKKTRSKHN